MNEKSKKGFLITEKAEFICLIALEVFLAVHYFARLFNNCMNIDECIVVTTSRVSFSEMMGMVAKSGHTPLHYTIAWILVKLFGESAFIYHLSSALPYFICLVITATLIRKWFGNRCAIIFTLLLSLLSSARYYNTMVRMYVWCQLFVLLAYLCLYKIFKESGKCRYYLLLTIFSAGAAYSHYFALVSMGLMYLVLFVYAVIANRKSILKVLISGCGVLVLFAPWVVYSWKTKGVVVSDYGISQVSWFSCFEYIFHMSKFELVSILLLILFFCMIIVQFVRSCGMVLFYEKKDSEAKKITVHAPKNIDSVWVWVLSGIVAPIGTIVLTQLFSRLCYPIICVRYIYPSYIMIWLLFSIAVTKTKYNKRWFIAVSAVLICLGYPVLVWRMVKEVRNNIALESTLEATSDIGNQDCIYTDSGQFAWTQVRAYYPNRQIKLIQTDKLPELDSSSQSWLFLVSPISEKELKQLDEQGKTAVTVFEKGYMESYNLWIYKIIDK